MSGGELGDGQGGLRERRGACIKRGEAGAIFYYCRRLSLIGTVAKQLWMEKGGRGGRGGGVEFREEEGAMWQEGNRC